MISYGSPNETIQTDATNLGWGALLISNGIQKQGHWNENEAGHHINVLELLAVKHGLAALCNEFSSIHLCVKSDSSTAVNYINNMGGSVTPLLKVTKDIWVWASSKSIFLSAVHVPGKENLIPDNLSGQFSYSSEWKLHESVFNAVCQTFFKPHIDLFATRINKQLP